MKPRFKSISSIQIHTTTADQVMKQVNLFLFVILMLYCKNAQSQTLKFRGCIVKNSGDTLYGWIDYSNWSKTPLIINFRKDSLSNQIEYYLPTELRYFELTGFQAFKSFAIKWEDLPVKDIHKKQENLYNRLIQDTVFMKIEVKGAHFSLYSHYDGVDIYYFIQENGNAPLELQYCRCKNGAHEDTEEHNLFRELLMVFAIKHGFRGKLLEKIAYSSIHKVPNIIEEMNNRRVSFKSKLIEGSGISWFASAGYGYSYLRVPVRNLYSAYPGTVAMIGAGVDLLTSRYFRTLMVRVDFFYKKFSFQDVRFDGLAYSISLWYQNIIKKNIKFDAGVGLFFQKSNYSDYTKEYLDRLIYHLENNWEGIDARARLLFRNTWEIGITTSLLATMTPSLPPTNPNVSSINLSYHLQRKKRP